MVVVGLYRVKFSTCFFRRGKGIAFDWGLFEFDLGLQFLFANYCFYINAENLLSLFSAVLMLAGYACIPIQSGFSSKISGILFAF